ncbi:unnamed protein product [Leptosia nina]
MKSYAYTNRVVTSSLRGRVRPAPRGICEFTNVQALGALNGRSSAIVIETEDLFPAYYHSTRYEYGATNCASLLLSLRADSSRGSRARRKALLLRNIISLEKVL